MEVPTPGGNRYIMTVIDDCSRFCVVYLLQRKSQAAEKIQEYIDMVRTQFGKVPKVIRSDGGGEYTGESMKAVLRRNGVVQQLTAPYCPQQNGKAERKNRSLIEMTRCLLSEAGLDQKYWGEAVCTANYILNRVPASATGRTPCELWHGDKPNYSHMKVFGSPAFVHVPKERRKKLDQKSVRMIFVGYAEGRKAYRFLNPDTNTVVISRDARFVEELVGNETIREVLRRKDVKIDPAVVVNVDEADSVHSEEDREEEYRFSASDEEFLSVEQGSEESEFEGFPEDEIRRRSHRRNKGKPPTRLIEEINAVSTQEEFEPASYQEAVNCPQKKIWLKAMHEELASHRELGSWSLVELPPQKKTIGSKWVYSIKRNEKGDVVRYKARLVAQGCGQKPGVDFEEVYAPVAKQATLRALLAVASQRKMHLKHLDVRTAYLHGDLAEEVFMRQPPGFAAPGRERMVCRLHKSVYGLRQSARRWNSRFDDVLKKIGFKQSSADPCLYTSEIKGKKIYVLIYVDDVVVGCEDESLIDRVYAELKKYFDITSLGNLKYFLGLEVNRVAGNYSVCLAGYIQRTAQKFGLGDCKSARTPMEENYARGEIESPLLKDSSVYRSLVGSLLYIAVHARPDIAHATSVLGRKVNQPSEADWVAAKRVVRYLRGTLNKKLSFNGSSMELMGFADADWAGDCQSRKSTSGYVFKIGGAAISWRSAKQSSVSLSSMESEYISLCDAAQETIWLRRILEDIGVKQKGPTTIFEDNQACLAFVRSERTTKRSKHIETKEMFVQDLCRKGVIKLEYLCSEDMIADALTKSLGTVKVNKFAEKMGLN